MKAPLLRLLVILAILAFTFLLATAQKVLLRIKPRSPELA